MNFYDWPASQFNAFANSLIVKVDGHPYQAPFPFCWQLHSQRAMDALELTDDKDPAAKRLQILECLNGHDQMRHTDLIAELGTNHQATLQHCRILHSHKLIRLLEDDTITVQIVAGWKSKIKKMESTLKAKKRGNLV